MAFDTEIMNQVKSLTDHEVFTRLKELGFDIGPVMKTTRSVYERKLYKALTGEADQGNGSIGDQPSLLVDDDYEDEGDDDDGDESSYLKRSAMKGSGDFKNSSKLFVEDSCEEEEEDDGDKNFFLDGTSDRRTKAGVELGRDEPKNARFLSRASVEDEDDGRAHGVQNVQGSAKGRLYPELERSDEASKEEVEYYLRKYGPSDDDGNSYEDYEYDASPDTSELRRRPLHSVRDVQKTYPVSFAKSSIPKSKEPEKTTPLLAEARNALPLLDRPSKLPQVDGVSSVKVVRDEPPLLCRAWTFAQSPLAVGLLVVILLGVLVFLSLEPEPELPKLDIGDA